MHVFIWFVSCLLLGQRGLSLKTSLQPNTHLVLGVVGLQNIHNCIDILDFAYDQMFRYEEFQKFLAYDQDVIFMFGDKHKFSHICTPSCCFRMCTYLVMGGEMTKKLKIIEYQQAKEGFFLCLVLGVPRVPLPNPMFGLAKQSLVIGFRMTSKMRRTHLNKQGANKELF